MNKLKRIFFKKALGRFSKEKVRYLLDFIFFGVGFFISSAIVLGISILVNKGMTKEDLGLFNYNKSVLEFLAFTFTIVMYRSYLRFNIEGINLSLVKKVKTLNTVAFLLLCCVAYSLTRSYWSLFFSFFIFYEERLYFFRSLMLIKKVNFLKITISSITLLLVVYLFFNNSLEPDLVLFCYGIGFLVTIFFKTPKKTKTDTEKISWKTILLFSFPALGAMAVKLSLDLSSQYLIKENFDLVELSKYAIATRTLLSVKIFSSLLMMFFPVIYYREIKKKNLKFINSLRLLLFFVMSIIVVAALFFNNEIYWLMGASKYDAYTNLFNILVISELVFIIGGIFGIFLTYRLKTHISLLIFILGAILNIVLLKLFLKDNGIKIAPYSILVSNVVMTLLFIITSVRYEYNYSKKL